MWGRSLYRNIQRFVLFQLTINFVAILICFVGAIFGTDMPLTVVQILWVNIIMGTITGAAGGMFRDIFINEVPLIFRKEIYAMACLSGGVVYYLCVWVGMNTVATQIIAAVSVILVRILSVHFRISLPSLKNIDSQNPDGNRNGDNGL